MIKIGAKKLKRLHPMKYTNDKIKHENMSPLLVIIKIQIKAIKKSITNIPELLRLTMSVLVRKWTNRTLTDIGKECGMARWVIFGSFL